MLGTMLGSAFVFFMRDEMSVRLQKSLLGFASGVMVAASVWSLLIPAIEMASASDSQLEELIQEASNGQHSNLSTIGFAIGFVLMMVLDVVMG